MHNPISQKITVNRDVVFEKEENWDWGKKNVDGANDDSHAILALENKGENGDEDFLHEEEHA